MSIFLATPVFTAVGALVLVLALLVFDRTVKYRIVADSEHDNAAAATVTAGLIIHGALAHTTALLDFVILSVFGIVVNVLCFHLLGWITPGWNLNRAIHEKASLAAGIMAGGVLVAVGLLVSGAMA